MTSEHSLFHSPMAQPSQMLAPSMTVREFSEARMSESAKLSPRKPIGLLTVTLCIVLAAAIAVWARAHWCFDRLAFERKNGALTIIGISVEQHRNHRWWGPSFYLATMSGWSHPKIPTYRCMRRDSQEQPTYALTVIPGPGRTSKLFWRFNAVVFEYAWERGTPLLMNAPTAFNSFTDSELVTRRDLFMPVWALVAVQAPLQTLYWLHWLKLRAQRRRRRLGLCIRCGYDVRANSERCPECGTPVPEKSRPEHAAR